MEPTLTGFKRLAREQNVLSGMIVDYYSSDFNFFFFTKYIYSGIQTFRTSKGNQNWFEKLDSSRNRRQNYSVRLRRGKRLLVRVIERFEKMRVREFWIPLYIHNEFPLL